MHPWIRSLVCLFCLTALLYILPTIPIHAAPIDEVEPNDTIETAQVIDTIGTENPISASFGAATDVDWFRFEAVAGETYVVELFNVAGATNTRGYSPGLRIFDVNSSKIAEAVHWNSNGAGNANQGVQFAATSSGTHYIQVTHYSSHGAAGPYNLRILPNSSQDASSWDEAQEPNNYSGIAFPLEIGRTAAITSSIEARNSSYITNNHDRDWFRVETAKDQWYAVETFNVAKSIQGNGYAMQLKIYDSDFTVVAEDTNYRSNGGGNTNSSMSFQATKGGTYFILVYPYNNAQTRSGPYNIRVLPQSDHAEASWDADHEPNNWSVHAFELAIGSTQAITTSIEERNNSYIAENHDRDWFRFETVKDQRYAVETFNVAKAIQGNGYAMQLEIYDSDFTKVAEDTTHRSNGGGNTNSSIDFQATKGGTYFIKVYPYSDNRTGSGPYSIRILPQSDQAEASWGADHEPNNWSVHAFGLSVGSTQSITTSIEKRNSSYIAENHDRDWFRFEAEEEIAYAVEIFNAAGAINGNGYAMYIEIYDSGFTEVAKRTDYRPNGGGTTNAGASFVATQSGTHYIKVYPYADRTTGSGPYSIRVLPHFSKDEASWDANHEPNNWSIHAHELQIGRENALTTNIEPRNSSYLNTHADYDWFRFEAIAGADYVVETFNAAGAISTPGYPLQVIVQDSDSTEVGRDTQTSYRTNGAGNVNASVGFRATKGGTYSILVYPYASGAGSGPYSIRVLPRYDQPTANWDAAFEPNNWRTHAAPLDLLPCGQRTTIEPRNSSYLTHNADRDWFAVNVVEGQEYRLDLFDVSARFGRNGLYLHLYDREDSKLFEERGTDIRHVFTANYTGLYFVWVAPYDANANGTYRIRVVPTDGEECPDRPNPRVEVEGCASVGINPETGEVTLRGTPRSTCNQTIKRVITCDNGSTPTNVTLTIGDRSFAMAAEGNNRYSVTLNPGADLPTGRGPFTMSISRTCPGQVAGENSVDVGKFVLFDPSGVIRDVATNQPIAGATVTLHRIAGLVPDTDGQNGDCRTVNTNGGDWNLLQAAPVDSTQAIDPLLDAINNVVQISPATNPQVTGQDGSYAWDVVEGCWYVAVEAEGYQTVSSPLVGVPPEVTDLDLQMSKVASDTYLPLVQR